MCRKPWVPTLNDLGPNMEQKGALSTIDMRRREKEGKAMVYVMMKEGERKRGSWQEAIK